MCLSALDIATHLEAARSDITRYLARRTGDFHFAEDLVQRTAITAISKRRKAPSEHAKIRSWLFSIALNHFRNARRKADRRRELLEEFWRAERERAANDLRRESWRRDG